MNNPVLVDVYRGGLLESFHRGSVCAVNEQGKIVFSLGDPNQICYPRSAMKLMQALPLIELGGVEKFGLSREEIAITCGSHNGEAEHLRVVRSLLKKCGLDETLLGCGPQYPTHKQASDALVRAGEKPLPIHNNCSGKHAGMLALCKLLDLPTNDYLNPQHPVQKRILDAVEELYEWPRNKMVCALDGCTAPIYSIPVYQQALAYKNLVTTGNFRESLQNACRTVVEVMGEHPHLIAGTGRYCTDMMNTTAPQVIGKTGAEGIFCMTFTQQKIGVCIKIDDGKMQPQYNVAQALLEASGLFPDEQLKSLHHYAVEEIRNFNRLSTGELAVRSELFSPFRDLFR